MNKQATDIVAYIGLIGWIIALCATSDRKQSELALNQGLVLVLADIIAGIVAGPVIGTVIITFTGVLTGAIAGLFSVAILVFRILGIINAAQGKDDPLPLIGEIKLMNF